MFSIRFKSRLISIRRPTLGKCKGKYKSSFSFLIKNINF